MTTEPWERGQRAVDADIAAIRAVRQMRAAVAPLAFIAASQQADHDGHEEQAYTEEVARLMAKLHDAEQEHVDDLLAIEREGGPLVPKDYRKVSG